MTKLIITVDYQRSAFLFSLSHTDASGTAWTSSLLDGGIVAFTNSGQYTLKDGAGSSRTFTFDAIGVVLGSTLQGLPQKQCGAEGGTFSLSSIVFPAIPAGDSSVAIACSWCQATFTVETPVFKDPKLGLSNTTGNNPAPAVMFTSCACG